MRLPLLSFIGTLILLSCAPCLAEEAPVKIEKAWVRAVPPGSSATAAYMIIRNPGTETIKLIGGEAGFAGRVKPMITVRKTVDGKEVSGMELVDALEIPAGGEVVLKPGGDHLMLMEMTSAPAPGKKVKLTLIFASDAKTMTITIPVRRTAPQ